MRRKINQLKLTLTDTDVRITKHIQKLLQLHFMCSKKLEDRVLMLLGHENYLKKTDFQKLKL